VSAVSVLGLAFLWFTLSTTPGALELRRVTIETRAASIEVRRLWVDWRPLNLLRRRIVIDSLEVEGVEARLHPAQPEEPSPEEAIRSAQRQPIRPPFGMAVAVGKARDITIAAPGGLDIHVAELRLAGNLAAYSADVALDLSSPQLPNARLRATTRGDLDSLALQPLTAELLDGRVEATGSVAWYPELRWRVTLNGSGLAPGSLAPDPSLWPGQFDFRAASEGRIDSAAIFATAQLDTLLGELRDRPLSASASAQLAGPSISLARLDLVWGSNRAHAAGELADSLDVALQVEAPDLSEALPGGSGRLSIDARVGGTRSLPHVEARVNGERLAFGANQVGRLAAVVNLDLADPHSALLDLEASQVAVSGRSLPRIVVRGRGNRSTENPNAIALEQVEADVLGGMVRAAGWVAWKPRPAWDVTIDGRNLSPASLFPNAADWPGRSGFRAATRGSFEDAGPVAFLAVDTVSGTLRGQRLSGKAEANVDGKQYTLRGASVAWGPARGAVRGRAGEDFDLYFELDVPDLSLVAPATAGSLRAEGRARGSPELPELRATLTAHELGFQDHRVEALTAEVNLGVGQADKVEVALVASGILYRRWPIDRFELEGQGIRTPRTLTGLAIRRAHAELLDGSVRATGQVLWRPELRWQLALEASDLAPAPLFPDPSRWPGHLSLAAETDGVFDPAHGARLRAALDTLQGDLRERSLAGRASLQIDGTTVTVPNLDVTWGRTTLHAHGQIGDALDFSLQAEAPDLAEAMPGASGAATLDAVLGGSRASPSLRAHASASDLRFAKYGLATLDAEADVDLGDPGRFELDLTATQIAYGEREIERIHLTGRGDRSAHQLAATLASRDPQVDLLIAGRLEDDHWQGELRRLAVASSLAGDWRLRAPTQIEGARDDVLLREVCLDSRDGFLCGEVSWRRGAGWAFASTIRQLPLAIAEARLPDGWSVRGALDGEVDVVAAAEGELSGSLELRPGPGTITFPLAADTQTVSYEQGLLAARVGDRGLDGEFDLRMTRGSGSPFGSIEADFQLPELTGLGQPLGEQPLTGRIDARWQYLTLLEALTTRLVRTAGRLDLQMNAGGSLSQPILLGETHLTGGRADIPALGLQLRDIEFIATGDGRGGIAFTGSVSSGPGRLAISGESPVVPTADAPLRIRLRGDRFQAANTAEVQLQVSPEIEVGATADQLTVSGEVAIPMAKVELRERPQFAAPLSEDVIFEAEDSVQQRPGRRARVTGRVRLVLGNEVSFKGLGFTTDLEGSLLAIEEPGRPTAGSGELTIVSGKYKAYGQDLTIDRGRVIFAGGPIDNPGLDARAYRVAKDTIVAGLLIKGTLKSPEVTLYSEPPMTEAEALAYLVIGRPLNETSGEQGGTLTKAANSLGLRGGNVLARRIAATVGLDEARIESRGRLQEASFLAGKYLSPRLYVGYGIGLFDHVSNFKVRYMLSGKWTVVGETGRATSTDILYRIERGR
jgi:translocation and assembly module TamB